MKYAKSVLITLIVRGLAIPIGIASSVVTARYLGPSGRGVLVLLTVLQGLAIQFGTLGFNGSIVYFIAKDSSQSSRVVSVAIGVAAVVGIAVAGILAVAARIVPGAVLGAVDVRYLNVFLVAIPCGFFQQFLQNVLLARQRIAEYNLLDLAVRIIQLAAFAIVLILLGGSTMDAVLCVVGVTILSATLYLIRTSTEMTWPYRFDRDLLGQMVRYGTRTYASSVIMFLAMRVNLIIVNSLLGEAASGTYSVVMQIADLTYLLPITLGTLLFPKVSSRGPEETELTAKTLRFSFVAMLLIGVCLLVLSKPLILLLYGRQFVSAVTSLQWYVPGIVALALVMIINNDLAGRGFPWIVVWAASAGLVVNTVTTMYMASRFGIDGAAMASSISYVTILCVLMIYYLRTYGVSLRHLFIPYWRDFNVRQTFR